MRPDIKKAILGMYDTIEKAADEQAAIGHSDRGRRSGITSGKHLDTLTDIIHDDLVAGGFEENEIFAEGRTSTLPGWFRPTKNWDLLGFDGKELVCAIELKSISSSFGNNTNNRVEESIGSAVDAEEAYNKRLLGPSDIRPVMGYVMIVRDCDKSRAKGHNTYSPHFEIDQVFKDTTYLERYRIFCKRLRRKNLYNAVWLTFVDQERSEVYEPDPSMSYEVFLETILSGLRMHRAAAGKTGGAV